MFASWLRCNDTSINQLRTQAKKVDQTELDVYKLLKPVFHISNDMGTCLATVHSKAS